MAWSQLESAEYLRYCLQWNIKQQQLVLTKLAMLQLIDITSCAYIENIDS